MSERRASRQDIRPLQIGLVNLMPKKVQTETQFARVIGATPLQIELTLIRMSHHRSKNAPAGHMEAFYRTFRGGQVTKVRRANRDWCADRASRVRPGHLLGRVRRDDGLDPVQCACDLRHLLGRNGDALLSSRHHQAHAGREAVRMFPSPDDRSGLPLSAGVFPTIWSSLSVAGRKCTRTRSGKRPISRVLVDSPVAGPCLIEDPAHRSLYMFNHLEYDSDTLKQEYERDVEAGVRIGIPNDYFPGDDTSCPPQNRWRAHGHLLYGNWINQIYQTVPYDIADIGSDP